MTTLTLPRFRAESFDWQRLVEALFAAFVFFGMLSLIEPSPYDFLALIAIPAWFVGGFRVPKTLVPILTLWAIFEAAGFLSLMPYWDEHDARLYQLQSLYLFVTTIFFTLFFAERTERRAKLCLDAYTAGAIISALAGLVGYLDLGGLGSLFTMEEGRVSATFKDPNVFGSYLILSIVYLLQRLLLGSTRHRLLSILGVFVMLIGVFVSFSRGSWGACLAACILTVVAAFVTAETKALRLRVVRTTLLAGTLGVAILAGLLAIPNTRNFFIQRAQVSQDYDEGVTGRFGNQVRSLPMLVERPLGFGPLRFPLIFGLAPHNSFVGGFANDGWIGGFTWIWIVLMSLFVGFRLMFKRSPYRRLGQVFAPAMIVLIFQGVQIDVDHWRQLFLCFGAVWGLEAARLKWVRANASRSKLPLGAATVGTA